MIKESILAFFKTIRGLFSELSALAILMGIYALLLGALYGFVAVREATVWQVLLTLLFIALVPLLFFMLQASVLRQALTGKFEWSKILRTSTRLAIVSIPVILIGWGAWWLLNRWQAHYPYTFVQAPVSGAPAGPGPTHWPSVIFAAARVLIFGFALPLALIHLWVAATSQEVISFFRGGIRSVGSNFGKLFGNAFSAGSVAIYILGLLIFAALPYALITVHLPMPGAWRAITILTLRLILVFAFILVGWVITLRTFAKRSIDSNGLVPAVGEMKPDPNDATVATEPEMSTV